jgi:hypothetical protein
MGFHEQAIQALERNPGTWYCIDCWAQAAGLTSPEDKIKLSALARTFATTSDPTSAIGDCEECKKKRVRVVRSLPRN